MKYRVDRIADGGVVCVEEGDIRGVTAGREHGSLDLVVRFRKEYVDTGAYTWSGRRNALLLPLLPRQVKEILAQSLERRFCEGCYDHGKTHHPPRACVRCVLIEACQSAGTGDFRRARPAVAERTYGNEVAYALLIFALIGALHLGADSESRARRLQAERDRLAAMLAGTKQEVRARTRPASPPL